MKKKILFLIHDLGQGGAEKVLVNLVNNMDPGRFDITVTALFGGGVNERFLREHIRYRTIFRRVIPANTYLMKLFSPGMLHRMFIREHYDAEIAFLEGSSARIIAGCQDRDTKLVSWIHSTIRTEKQAAFSFRGPKETINCYNRFDRMICVAGTVMTSFMNALPITTPAEVLYNVNESEEIRRLARETCPEVSAVPGVKLVCAGRLIKGKGVDRLVRTVKKLNKEGKAVHLFVLGNGPEEAELRELAKKNNLSHVIHFMGYQINPYKYMAGCDLFVCPSYSEGFSTAATEALIVGIPVCTTEVSGMRELLGENEYGLIVENTDESLYEGIKYLLDDPARLLRYREAAKLRGERFSTRNTVEAVEEMLLELTGC